MTVNQYYTISKRKEKLDSQNEKKNKILEQGQQTEDYRGNVKHGRLLALARGERNHKPLNNRKMGDRKEKSPR